MLLVSRARQIGLTANQQLWLEAMDLYGKPTPKPKPMRIRGKGFTFVVIDDVQAHFRHPGRRLAASAARRCRPALRRAAVLLREGS